MGTEIALFSQENEPDSWGFQPVLGRQQGVGGDWGKLETTALQPL